MVTGNGDGVYADSQVFAGVNGRVDDAAIAAAFYLPSSLSSPHTVAHIDALAANRLFRFACRPCLFSRQVSSVLLRQNPHNVNEWQKRVKLFAEDPRKAIICYTEVSMPPREEADWQRRTQTC